MPDSRSAFFPVLAITVHLFIVFTVDGGRVTTLLLATPARHSSFPYLNRSCMHFIRCVCNIGHVEHNFLLQDLRIRNPCEASGEQSLTTTQRPGLANVTKQSNRDRFCLASQRTKVYARWPQGVGMLMTVFIIVT